MSHSDFTVTFNTDNDAFAAAGGDREIARILRTIAEDLEAGQATYGQPQRIRDSNGARVGFWIWADRDCVWVWTDRDCIAVDGKDNL